MNSLSLRKAVQAELQTKLLSNEAIERTESYIILDGFYYCGGLSDDNCIFSENMERALLFTEEDAKDLKTTAQRLQEKFPDRDITFEHGCSIYIVVKEPYVQIHKLGEN